MRVLLNPNYCTVMPGVRKCAISEIWRKFRQLVEAWIRAHLIDFLMGHLESASILPPFEAYGPNFRFYSKFLLVNSKIYKIMSHKIFQTQKGVNFTLPKTYPYMTLSNNTNNLTVLAVCKNFIMMAHFLTPGITVQLWAILGYFEQF